MTAQKTAAAPQTKPEAVPAKPATKPQGQVQHTITPTKDAPVATDLNKLSFNDLQKQREALLQQQAEIEALLASKRAEEIKVLADGYAKKAAAAGFTPQEAIDALLPYLPAKLQRSVKGGKAAKPAAGPKKYIDSTGAAPELNTTYKLPDGSMYTTKSKLGRTPDDVQQALAKGGKWAEWKVK